MNFLQNNALKVTNFQEKTRSKFSKFSPAAPIGTADSLHYEIFQKKMQVWKEFFHLFGPLDRHPKFLHLWSRFVPSFMNCLFQPPNCSNWLWVAKNTIFDSLFWISSGIKTFFEASLFLFILVTKILIFWSRRPYFENFSMRTLLLKDKDTRNTIIFNFLYNILTC